MKMKFAWIFLCFSLLLVACSDDEEVTTPTTSHGIYQIYLTGEVIYNKIGVSEHIKIEGIKVTLVPNSIKDNENNICLNLEDNTSITDADGKFVVRITSYSSLVGDYSLIFEDIDGEKNGYFENSKLSYIRTNSEPETIYSITSPPHYFTRWVMYLKENKE